MLHILIALSGVFTALYTLIKPSRAAFFTNYSLLAATSGSGLLLVIVEPARMLHTCVAGLSFIAVVSALSFAAHKRFKHRRANA